jgi:hypothetical protein
VKDAKLTRLERVEMIYRKTLALIDGREWVLPPSPQDEHSTPEKLAEIDAIYEAAKEPKR